jgi:hypothetical protein
MEDNSDNQSFVGSIRSGTTKKSSGKDKKEKTLSEYKA